MFDKAAVSTALLVFAASGAFAVWRIASTSGSYSGIFGVGVVAAVGGLIAVTQVVGPANRRGEPASLWIGVLWLCAFALFISGLAAGLRD